MRVKYWKSCPFWQCFMQDSLHHTLTGKCLGFIIKSKQTILCYQHCSIPWCIAVEVLLVVCGWRIEGDVVLHTSVRVQQHTAKQQNCNGDVTWSPLAARQVLTLFTIPSPCSVSSPGLLQPSVYYLLISSQKRCVMIAHHSRSVRFITPACGQRLEASAASRASQ